LASASAPLQCPFLGSLFCDGDAMTPLQTAEGRHKVKKRPPGVSAPRRPESPERITAATGTWLSDLPQSPDVHQPCVRKVATGVASSRLDTSIIEEVTTRDTKKKGSAAVGSNAEPDVNHQNPGHGAKLKSDSALHLAPTEARRCTTTHRNRL